MIESHAIATLRTFVDRFLGRGDATITVPPFDGALKPNQLLEKAETVALLDAAEDITTDGQAIYIADGAALLRFAAGSTSTIRSFDRTITALCCLPDGRIAIALDGREVRVFATPSSPHPDATFADPSMNAVNALAPGPDGTLVATDGSTLRTCGQWAYDLMERGQSGRLFSLDIVSGRVRRLASGLHYAFGVCAFDDALLVSESWRHRLIAVATDGSRRAVLDNLPVYPSRISVAPSGGFWLTAFIARTQLVEFVLRESGYRRRMMKEIDPQYWVAPKLRSGQSFLEPMQGAHIKTMGVVKPWAPPRSYGLVIKLNAGGIPLYALHSRADGINHGVVAAVETDGALFALAKGPQRLLRMPLGMIEQGLRV
jgi:sugar lactone lactonase YvrE